MGVGGEVEDAPVEIHLASATDGLPAEIFDGRLAYVALGHFHRSFKVKESAARYCGTPVPLTARESATPRRVLLVDLPEGGRAAEVSSLEVPLVREVLQVTGTPEQVLEQLRALAWETPMPPLVMATLEVAGYEPGLEVRLQRETAWVGEDSPNLLRVTQRQVGAVESGDDPVPVSLKELTVEEVFRRLCQTRMQELDQPLLAAFRSLLTEDEEVSG